MENVRKAISIAIIIALIINLILFAARKIHGLQFWIVVVFAAVIAFFVLPKISSKKSGK